MKRGFAFAVCALLASQALAGEVTMILWLDCYSEFCGAYEDPEAQALGQIVRPSLD